MTSENEFCKCNSSKGIYIVNDDFGYWEYCSECDKKLEDGFHYYDEPVLY